MKRISAAYQLDFNHYNITYTDLMRYLSSLKELYEMAQRKLLRQLAGYVEDQEPFPRLFVADLNYDPAKGPVSRVI